METMTQEDKELLLRDLCARLPYGVKLQSYSYEENIETIETLREIDSDGYISTLECDTLKYIYKPYLFPLSSMTEEQYKYISYNFGRDGLDYIKYGTCDFHSSTLNIEDIYELVDWLNKNQFDYRGLIEKGLAIDATGLNIY